MKPSTIFQNIPCTLVTGFLGAGKTTVINQLLATKPVDERWALLINEFGHIGIDGALLASSQDSTAEQDSIAIREVSGGCICCTSQLPLQIAISRLLSDHHPQRLLIEPTGLAHPRELIRQLSASHWQTALKMQAVITVLSGVQWQQVKYRTHEGFQAHVRDADVLVVNRYDQLNAGEKQALIEWIATLNSQASIIWAVSEPMTTDTTEASSVDLAKAYASALSTQLSKPSQVISAQRKVAIASLQRSTVSLRPQTNSLTMASSASTAIDESDTQNITNTGTDTDLPYRYHENQQDLALAGWRLPASYILNADDLQNWLLALPNWQRIKGVVHTSDGWLQINFTPDSLTTSTVETQSDSRLEIILQLEDISDTALEATDSQYQPKTSTAIDWEACDRELMAMVI
nr:GTP-binding protein [Psychrobacter sp. SWN149]